MREAGHPKVTGSSRRAQVAGPRTGRSWPRCRPVGDQVLRQVVAQGVGTLRVAQLGHRLALDLADPLAGETELLADLLQRPRLVAVQAEAQDDHVALPVLERRQ